MRGKEERDRSVYRHGQERVEEGEEASELLVNPMQGQPVKEKMHAAGSVQGAWKSVMD